MKKILAILLVLCMALSFAACGSDNKDKKEPVNNTPVVDDIEENLEETKKMPILEGEDEFVVARSVGSNITIKDITEIANYKVGIINNSDSQLIGEYYCGEENVSVHGTDLDAFSELMGGNVDLVICRKISAEARKDAEIILDPIKMIELK